MLIQMQNTVEPQHFLQPDIATVKVKRQRSWHCTLAEMLVGNYLIVPLTTVKDLRSESYWLSNCCVNYVKECLRGFSQLFSIRTRSGERLATLVLSNDGERWRVDHCYGPDDSEVMEERLEYLDEDGIAQTEYWPTELYYISHEVVRIINAEQYEH